MGSTTKVSQSRLETPALLRRGLILLAVLLSALSLSYLIKGYHYLTISPKDLHGRWVECRFALHGQDPFQIYLHQYHGPDPEFNRVQSEHLASIYSHPEEPVYPPWAYAPALIFAWPAWRVDLIYYMLIDTACIAILVAGALRICKPRGTLEQFAVAAGTLGIASICTTLGNGNFGLIVITAIMLTFWFDRRNFPVVAGVLFWIAMIKPTISLPFAVVFLLRGRWKPLVVTAALSIASCLFPWIVDRTDPLTMLREAVQTARHFQYGGYGMINWLQQSGVPEPAITPLAAVLVIVPSAIFFFFNRNLPLWKNLAILAVLGRFWGYHMAHDNIMLFFLSCALWRILFASSSVTSAVALLIAGGTLWMPSSLTELGVADHTLNTIHYAIGILQHAIWLAAAIFVWRWKPSHDAVSNQQSPIDQTATSGAM